MALASDSEIQRYGVLSEPAGRDLQALVELAADFFGVETAAINLIASDEQHQVATAGFEPSICSREDSMCAAVVDHPGAVVVPDASRDDRFADNPFVTGEIGSVRFYASAPLVTPEMLSMEPAVADRPELAEMVSEINDAGTRMSRLSAAVTQYLDTAREQRRSDAGLDG